VEGRNRQALQATVGRYQPKPGGVRHGGEAQDHQQSAGELVLVVGLQPPERHEEVQRVGLDAVSVSQPGET
jgi:hypothetical protein